LNYTLKFPSGYFGIIVHRENKAKEGISGGNGLAVVPWNQERTCWHPDELLAQYLILLCTIIE
jgi:hypothetical protein